MSLASYLHHVSIEPVYFFYYTTYLILDQVNTNLYLQKACRNTTIEPDLDTPCDNEKRGVLFASEINSNYRYIMFTLCILYTIAATCWSDIGRHRRPLIFLPILGQMLQSFNGCFHSYFWYWPPIVAVLTDMLFEAGVGGVTLFLVASQIYMCDITNTENRTMRIGLLLGVKTLCTPIGNGSAGFLIRNIGFFYSYSLCLVLSTISCTLAVYLVKDVSVPVTERRNFLQLFNITRIIDSFKVVFKPSLGSKRVVVLLLLILYASVYFTVQGEKTVFYLFLRYKFHWDERQFSLYLVYRHIGIILGTIFCSVILSKCLQIHDGLIGAFAGFWDVISVVGYLLASQNWHLYVGNSSIQRATVNSLPNCLPTPANRPITQSVQYLWSLSGSALNFSHLNAYLIHLYRNRIRKSQGISMLAKSINQLDRSVIFLPPAPSQYRSITETGIRKDQQV